MRFILIDNHSGYIFGDSANIGGQVIIGTPVEVATALDHHLGEYHYNYDEVNRHALASNESGYHVYSAPAEFPVAEDGTDQEMIDAVERDCKYMTTVKCTKAAA